MSHYRHGRSRPVFNHQYVILPADFLMAAVPTAEHHHLSCPSAPLLSSWAFAGMWLQGDTSIPGCTQPFPPAAPGRPQQCRAGALTHQALREGRHCFQGPEASPHLPLKGHRQSLRGVLLLALQMLGDIIVSVLVPAAFIFIRISSSQVSQHHGSSPPLLQAFRQEAEHIGGRVQPVNAKNTGTT